MCWHFSTLFGGIEDEEVIEVTPAIVPDPKKSAAELLDDALQNVHYAGQKLCGRAVGSIEREIGKLIDQYPGVLDEREDAIREILWREFLSELAVAVQEREEAQELETDG